MSTEYQLQKDDLPRSVGQFLCQTIWSTQGHSEESQPPCACRRSFGASRALHWRFIAENLDEEDWQPSSLLYLSKVKCASALLHPIMTINGPTIYNLRLSLVRPPAAPPRSRFLIPFPAFPARGMTPKKNPTAEGRVSARDKRNLSQRLGARARAAVRPL